MKFLQRGRMGTQSFYLAFRFHSYISGWHWSQSDKNVSFFCQSITCFVFDWFKGYFHQSTQFSQNHLSFQLFLREIQCIRWNTPKYKSSDSKHLNTWRKNWQSLSRPDQYAPNVKVFSVLTADLWRFSVSKYLTCRSLCRK